MVIIRESGYYPNISIPNTNKIAQYTNQLQTILDVLYSLQI